MLNLMLIPTARIWSFKTEQFLFRETAVAVKHKYKKYYFFFKLEIISVVHEVTFKKKLHVFT